METDERNKKRGLRERKVKWAETKEREECWPKKENIAQENEVEKNSNTE